jgi:hypothetical protein
MWPSLKNLAKSPVLTAEPSALDWSARVLSARAKSVIGAGRTRELHGGSIDVSTKRSSTGGICRDGCTVLLRVGLLCSMESRL